VEQTGKGRLHSDKKEGASSGIRENLGWQTTESSGLFKGIFFGIRVGQIHRVGGGSGKGGQRSIARERKPSKMKP